MTIHTIVFAIVVILSLATAYAVGKPAQDTAVEVKQSEEKDSAGTL